MVDLTTKQRLSFVLCTSVSAEEVLERTIDREFLLENGVMACNLMAAKITPQQLKNVGVECADLPTMGYSSLHLVDRAFCANAIAAYGVGALRIHFLQTANDAVAIAGSSSAELLGVTTEGLLELCVADPLCARGVVEQAQTLRGVTPKTLLDTGIRVNALKSLGYTATDIQKSVGTDVHDLELLGFLTPMHQ